MDKKVMEFINSLPEEIREKAKECKTQEELNEFVADNDLELPDEVLDMVAGGAGCNEGTPYCMIHKIPLRVDSYAYRACVGVDYYCTECKGYLQRRNIEWRQEG